jgi:predicted HAD superfamily hydrolase
MIRRLQYIFVMVSTRMTALPTPMQLRHLMRSKAVTLDVFDTALLRTVASPIDVFTLTAVRFARRHGRHFDPDSFRSKRIAAEELARRRASASGRDEISLAEIYESFDPDISTLDLAALHAEELATELDVCVPNLPVQRLYRKLSESGIRTAFVSDTYFPTEFVRRLLSRNGYSPTPEVFTSCEIGTTKYNGELFSVVADRMQLAPAQISHVCDNGRSDVINARRRGFKAYWYRPNLRQAKIASRPGETASALAQSLVGGVARALNWTSAGATSTWHKLGVQVAGPLY